MLTGEKMKLLNLTPVAASDDGRKRHVGYLPFTCKTIESQRISYYIQRCDVYIFELVIRDKKIITTKIDMICFRIFVLFLFVDFVFRKYCTFNFCKSSGTVWSYSYYSSHIIMIMIYYYDHIILNISPSLR